MNKGKTVVVAGALTIVAGALWAGWYFFIKAEADDLADARAEVTRWEDRVSAFRACMFGPEPLSSDSAEALAMREMLPVTGEQKSCTEYAKKLNRGVANDTGNLKIEHAWMTVDRAAAKVATAFAVYKSDYGATEADRRRGVSDLPTALEELDRAREELRTAASMPPAEAAGAPLPKPELIRLEAAGATLRSFDYWADPDIYEGQQRDLPSRASIVTLGKKTDSQPWRIVHAAGRAPSVVELARSGTRSEPSFPAGDWFVTITETGPAPESAAFSGKGAPVTLAAGTSPPIATNEASVADVLALGTPADGVIVFTAYRERTRDEVTKQLELSHGDLAPGRKIVFASATNAFPAQSFPFLEGRRAIDAQGNALVVWNEPITAAMRAAFVTPGKAPSLVELGEGSPRRLCMTTGYGWLTLAHGEVIRVSPEGMVPVNTRRRLLACGDRAAVFHDIEDEYEVCTTDCRTVSLVGTGDTQHVAVSDERVVAIRMRDKVLGVWTEGKAPVFYGLPDVLAAHAVVANGTFVDILASVNSVRPQDQQIMVVRVPMP